MYEVDGVFKGSESRKPIVEERTQILRLIFRVDLDDIVEETDTKELDRRIVRASVSDYLTAHNRDHLIDTAAGPDRHIYEGARAWRNELGFFVFGYVVYEGGRFRGEEAEKLGVRVGVLDKVVAKYRPPEEEEGGAGRALSRQNLLTELCSVERRLQALVRV